MLCWIVELPRFAVYHRPVSAFSGMIDDCEGLKLTAFRPTHCNMIAPCTESAQTAANGENHRP